MLGACGDPEQEPWIKWLHECYKHNPDVEGLNDSSGRKYASIDVKLGNAMMSMLQSGGEQCYNLYTEVIAMSNRYMRGNGAGKFTVIKGRQIIAKMLESLRTRDRLDLVYTIEQLAQIQYPGDAKLAHFRTCWMEIIHNLRPDDIPSERALRDTLHSKIKGSNLTQLELKFYDMMHVDDPNRSYNHLLTMIDRAIQRTRENKNWSDTKTGLRAMVDGRDVWAAPATSSKGDQPNKPEKAKAKEKKKKGDNKQTDEVAEDAAAVLPQPKAKSRNGKKPRGARSQSRGGNGGGSSSREGSPLRDTSKIERAFFWKGACRHGDNCRFSHKKRDKGGGKGKSRNSSTDSNRSRSDLPCHQWQKDGKCSFGNKRRYKRDGNAVPSEETGGGKEKLKAKPKRKEKAKAKGKAKAGAPAFVLGDADWNDGGESSEDAPRAIAAAHRKPRDGLRLRTEF